MFKNNAKAAFAWAVLVILALPASTASAEEHLPLSFTAKATGMGITLPPMTHRGGATIQMEITRWSTKEERDALYAALSKSDQGKFFNDLGRQAVAGVIRVTGRQGARLPIVQVRYARAYDDGDKRRIVLVTDQQINFYERRARRRVRDNSVSLVVFDVDQSGQGEGEVLVGVQLELDEEHGRFAVESFGSEPVWLKNVRRQ